MFNDYVKSESECFSLHENVAITHFHNFVCSGVNGVGLHGTQSLSCILECQCFNSFILWCATFTKTANKMQHTIGRSLLHFVSHETLFDINLFMRNCNTSNTRYTYVPIAFALWSSIILFCSYLCHPSKEQIVPTGRMFTSVSNIADYIPNAFRFNSRNFQNE